MRAVSYPPLVAENTEDGQHLASCGAHTDYGCVTILATDNKRGALQIFTKDGEWKNVDPIAGSVVVFLGDMVETWTNGLWSSPLHRVMYTAGEGPRNSLVFFYDPALESR